MLPTLYISPDALHMKNLFISNTQFEAEWGSLHPASSFLDSFSWHPLYWQLQYLSFFIADETRIPFISHPPDRDTLRKLHAFNPYLKEYICFDKAPTATRVKSLGHSALLDAWSKKNELIYDRSFSSLTPYVSKAFVFHNTPRLKGSAYIENQEKWKQVCHTSSLPFLTKPLFGHAGRGVRHYFAPEDFDHIPTFPCIKEPFVDKVSEFSSHFDITPTHISYLGTTWQQTNQKGALLSISAQKDNAPLASWIAKQQPHAYELAEKLQERGVFSTVSIDAMLYKENNQLALYPIVEMNLRIEILGDS